jgi:hypothetical protein
LIQKHLNQVLNRFSGIFIVFLFLKVIFFELFNHFLSTCPQLTIELNHGHVLNHQIIGAPALLIFFIISIFVLVLISGSRRLHRRQLGLLVLLELIFHDVLFDLSLLGQPLYYILLLGAVEKVVLVYHLEDWWDIV